MGSWLQGATPTEGGLLIPGRPRRHAATVTLTSAGLSVESGGAVGSLTWDDLDTRPSVDGWKTSRPAGWRVGPFALGRGVGIGVGLQLGPAAEDDLWPVLSTLRTLRNRMNRWMSGLPPTVPLCTASDRWGSGIQVFTELVSLLHQRPAARQRLGEPTRTARLAADLATCQLACQPEPGGVRRATTEVFVALRSCGYSHSLGGRPIAGDPLPTLDEVVANVIARIAASPYAKGVRIERGDVERLVRKHYLDIEPWPFGALVG